VFVKKIFSYFAREQTTARHRTRDNGNLLENLGQLYIH
jgi:hypothetical protein